MTSYIPNRSNRPKKYDIIICSNHAWPSLFCMGLVEEVLHDGVRITSSNGTAVVFSFQSIYFVIHLRLCPKRVLSMFNMAVTRICPKTITTEEANSIIQEYRNNAATCIQRAMVHRLYKPPTGAMYLRLTNKFNNNTTMAI